MRYFVNFNLFAVNEDILYFVEYIAWSFIYYFHGIIVSAFMAIRESISATGDPIH